MFEGTDLLAIEGMSFSTVLTLMSEVGIEGIRKFPSAKHFCSWLRLAPNNKISGGKVLSSKVPKGSNRLKIALRNAANAIGNLKDSTPLRDFFHRINFRKGRVSAISATARKLAVIIWNIIVNPNTETILPSLINSIWIFIRISSNEIHRRLKHDVWIEESKD